MTAAPVPKLVRPDPPRSRKQREQIGMICVPVSWRLFLPILNGFTRPATAGRAATTAACASSLALFIEERLLFLGDICAHGDVLIAVEIDFAVDDGFLDN